MTDPNPGAESWFLVLTAGSLPRVENCKWFEFSLSLELVSAFLMETRPQSHWWSPALNVAFPEGFGQKIKAQVLNGAVPDGCAERLPGGVRGVYTEIVAHPTESLMPVARGD